MSGRTRDPSAIPPVPAPADLYPASRRIPPYLLFFSSRPGTGRDGIAPASRGALVCTRHRLYIACMWTQNLSSRLHARNLTKKKKSVRRRWLVLWLACTRMRDRTYADLRRFELGMSHWKMNALTTRPFCLIDDHSQTLLHIERQCTRECMQDNYTLWPIFLNYFPWNTLKFCTKWCASFNICSFEELIQPF